MKEERFFYVPQAAENNSDSNPVSSSASSSISGPINNELPEQEAQHAIRVLRLAEGDEMFLMDGAGTFYRAKVSMATKKRCFYDICETLPQQKTWTGEIRLAVAPTKMMERVEWMVEKATEVGFDAISFIDCKFSERHTVKTDRIERIVVAAMKQSRKAYKPTVNAMADFCDFIAHDDADYKFIAHCYNDQQRVDLFDRLQTLDPASSVSVLIGPEGDFSADEVEMAQSAGYEPITLGNSRLRTETAGLMAVAMAQIAKRR